MLIGDGWSFVHIPKCGGTSVRAMLAEQPTHERADRMPMWPDHTVDHRFHWVASRRPAGVVFTVIRHPADWLASYWRHRMAHGWRPHLHLDRMGTPLLAEFARRVAHYAPGYIGRMYHAYANAIGGAQIYRLEDGLAGAVRQATGIELLEAHDNAGSSDPVSDAVRAIIARSESATIKQYGYG